MSSTNKTANLKLHSWVRTDPVVCEDFNDNFTKLDEAVGSLSATRGNCEIYLGSYIGDGAQTKQLTFPKLPVYLVIQWEKDSSATFTGFVVDGAYFVKLSNTNYYNQMFISGTTLTLKDSYSSENRTTNMTGNPYRYMAFVPAG